MQRHRRRISSNALWSTRGDDAITLKAHLPKTKGDLQKANDGEKNLILVAFELRGKASPLHATQQMDMAIGQTDAESADNNMTDSSG